MYVSIYVCIYIIIDDIYINIDDIYMDIEDMDAVSIDTL